VLIRKYIESDFAEILSLFYHTVHEVNVRDYSPEQIAVWAPENPDQNRWRDSLSSKMTYVAEANSKVVGFGELETSGHIDRFYIHKNFIRQGVGSALYKTIENQAKSLSVERLFLEASITAKPFFASQGFNVIKEQFVQVRGVSMVNFLMEKNLK